MDKSKLLGVILAELELAVANALTAADQAHATATHKENVAENKYDTLGLEAAYLAHGQSERVVQLENDLAMFRAIDDCPDEQSIVTIGSLVQLENEAGDQRYLFVGPAAGGLSVPLGDDAVTIITRESPLGQALIGCAPDDEIAIETAGGRSIFCVVGLW